jgi:hypothetical protein
MKTVLEKAIDRQAATIQAKDEQISVLRARVNVLNDNLDFLRRQVAHMRSPEAPGLYGYEQHGAVARIEKVLAMLHAEVEKGILDGDISENLHSDFTVPASRLAPGYVVSCEFRARPAPMHHVASIATVYVSPRLRQKDK